MTFFRSRLRRWTAGALLLAIMSLSTYGCSGGGGGAVQTLVSQAVAAFAGYFAGITVLGDDLMLLTASGDLNGDGLPDLAATSADVVDGTLVASLVVQLAQGPGQFGEPTLFPLGQNLIAFGLALGDFDGDGDLDAAAVGSSALLVTLNNGDGTFGEATPFPGAGTAGLGIVAADFDEDGDLDLAACAQTATPSQVAVLPGNGDGTFGAPTLFNAGLNTPAFLQAGDLTGDGNLDLAVTDSDGANVAILEGDGNGGFDAQTPVRVASGRAPSGGPGLVEQILAHLRRPPGEDLDLLTQVDVGASQIDLALADFNGDANLDIGVTIPQFPAPEGVATPAGGVAVVLGQGGGNFGSPANFPTSGVEPFGIASGDYNGDGIPDLAVSHRGNTVSVLTGDGAGGFTESDDQPTGITPLDILATDLDLDGRADAITSNQLVANWTFLRGEGDGTLIGTPRLFPSMGQASSNPLATGDLNGDGLDDVVLGSSSDTNLEVFLNLGNGTFSDPIPFPLGDTATALALGDMNGDGFPDAVVGRSEGQDVAVLLNDGAGGFGAPTGFNLGLTPDDLAVADFDQDGHLDVAAAVSDEDAVGVAPGDGAGGLGAFLPFATDLDGFRLTAGDWNGDGFPDLALAGAAVTMTGETAPTSQVSVLTNDGTGGFGGPTLLPLTGQQAAAITSGDFNSDGFPDLVATSTSPASFVIVGTVDVFANDGAGGFPVGVARDGGVFPADVLTGDLNRDGRLDLVTVDPFLSSVVIAWGDGEGGVLSLSAFNGATAPIFGALGNFNGDAFPDLATSTTPIGDTSATVGVLNSIVR